MTRITVTLMMLLSVGLVMATDPIPWPMQPQDGTHNLYHSYGDYHRSWSEVTASNPGINFHFGIDLTDPTPDVENDAAEDVYCVRSGFVTWMDWMEETPDPPAEHDNYAIVICDIEGQTTGYGWSYQHIEDRLYTASRGNPFEVGKDYESGDRISDIDNDASSQGGPGWTGDHLHFMRSDAEYDENNPGYCNPLYYFQPEPVQSAEFTWEWLCNPTQEYRFFVIPQYDALTQWGSQWLDLNACKTEIDGFSETISGAVDLVIWFVVYGTGSTGSISPRGCMPQQLEWWIEKWDGESEQWYEVQDITGTTYRRYPFDFGDIELGGSSDWERYKQLYFRFSGTDFLFPSGYMCCLTNCSDADDWDGIQNITESYWQTDIKSDLSGPTNNSALQLTCDGLYRVAVKPYVFNGINPPLALSTAYAELELHNSSPIVSEAEILDESMAVVWDAFWHAEETLRGLEAELVINVNESVQLDQELTATVVFSEPVNTSTIDITAGKPPYYNDLTVNTTGWSCTNNPEPYFDTWHGTIEIPDEEISGAIKLCIDGEDTDGNCLKDPAGAFTDEVDAYSDTYHGFGIAFSVQHGWPVTLHDYVWGSPVLADLDDDGDLDVVIQSTDGWVHVLSDTGSAIGNWPTASGDWGIANVYSTPAIVDLDGDGDNDVLAVKENGCNAWDVASGGSISGWPVVLGTAAHGHYPSHTSPAIEDVDNDGHPEVVVCRCLVDGNPSQHTVFLFEHTGGSETWSVNLDFPGGESVACTPAIGDVSSNHFGLEILVCTSGDFGYPYPLNDQRDLNSGIYLLDPDNGDELWYRYVYGQMFASPVVADVDDDGVNEVIVGVCGSAQIKKVVVLNGNTGTIEQTWNVGGWVTGPVAIGDINDDGYLDIVASVNGGTVECWSGEDYSSLDGFPVTVDGNPSRGPSIADIDGDFKLEIVIGTSDGYLYAINHDGSICSGYPVTCGNGVYSQVVIGNIDDDNSLEMIFADYSDPVLYCYDLGAGTFPAEMPWRQFQHDSWHTGCFAVDNTIPEPPTNLTGEITYTAFGSCEVELEWDLSVNDPYSGSPQEPADVIWYGIMRAFPMIPFHIIGRVHAGTCSYVDCFTAGGSVVVYKVFAYDGTNESEYSNIVKLPTSPSAVISLGCSVIEEFSVERASMRIPEITEMRITDESSHAEVSADHSRTSATVPTVTHNAVSSGGNPGCLTDGSTEVCYSPSPGADAVVIDLGEECTVTSVLPERVSGTFLDVSSLTDASVRTVETARVVEPSLSIEVAGSDREFYPFLEESRNSTDAVRYVRVCGASGLSEISVYGSRGIVNTVSSVEITRSVADESWMFAIPVVEYSEEAEVNIFDLTGRMIWSGHAESGSVLYWDGFTENGTVVPNGVYLLQCSIGSEVSTGSFVVRRN